MCVLMHVQYIQSALCTDFHSNCSLIKGTLFWHCCCSCWLKFFSEFRFIESSLMIVILYPSGPIDLALRRFYIFLISKRGTWWKTTQRLMMLQWAWGIMKLKMCFVSCLLCMITADDVKILFSPLQT